MAWFRLEENPYHNNEWGIFPSNSFYQKFSGIRGSYLVYPARLLGFTYGDWCRWCRDNFNAKLYGHNSKYVSVLFPNKADAETVIKILENRMNKIVKENVL